MSLCPKDGDGISLGSSEGVGLDDAELVMVLLYSKPRTGVELAAIDAELASLAADTEEIATGNAAT